MNEITSKTSNVSGKDLPGKEVESSASQSRGLGLQEASIKNPKLGKFISCLDPAKLDGPTTTMLHAALQSAVEGNFSQLSTFVFKLVPQCLSPESPLRDGYKPAHLISALANLKTPDLTLEGLKEEIDKINFKEPATIGNAIQSIANKLESSGLMKADLEKLFDAYLHEGKILHAIVLADACKVGLPPTDLSASVGSLDALWQRHFDDPSHADTLRATYSLLKSKMELWEVELRDRYSEKRDWGKVS